MTDMWQSLQMILLNIYVLCLLKSKWKVLLLSDPQDENKIGIDGIQQFCDDLNLDPASISVLVVAWKFRAATQCEFSKKEFLDGMTELGSVFFVIKCLSGPTDSIIIILSLQTDSLL